ncbi:MAG: serine/threonine-protein kinase [Chloroflexota bacterium]
MSYDPLIGKQLGDYVIESLLGQGGMARVYRGYDAQLDRYSAVKVIEPNLVASDDEDEYRERFRREARAIARLHHPNVVSVYQFGEMGNLYYMAMGFVEGRDLREILKEHHRNGTQMSSEEILQIVNGIAAALDYAHSQGVIHRDVKPSNIMVTADGRAILTDFGLALNAQEGTVGNTFGSVHYIAPEQAVSSAQAVPQSDLYSLGVVLFEMTTGRVPFEDASVMSVALKHITDTPPRPSLINPRISQPVEEVIFKALDKEPQRRYASGSAFAHALKGAFAVQDDEDTQESDFKPVVLPASSASDGEKSLEREQVRATSAPSEASSPLGAQDIEVAVNRPTAMVNPLIPERRGGRRLWTGGLLLIILIGGAVAVAAMMGGSDEANSKSDATDIAADVVKVDAPAVSLSATARTSGDTSTGAADGNDVGSTASTPSRVTEAVTMGTMPTITPTPEILAQNRDEPPILLEYDWRQIVIFNRSAGTGTVDVRNLSFAGAGNDDVFTSDEWQYEASRWRMRPQVDCFQILDATFVELATPEFCTVLQAFERTREPFWSSADGEATFEVRWQGETVATCPTTILGDDSALPLRCLVDPVTDQG